MKKTFNRSKTVWNNEQEALQDVCTKQNVTADQLEAAHTTGKWVWKTTTNTIDENSVSYSKADYFEQQAIEAAMLDLDTFEGNLAPAHTETNFVFSKVRA